MFKIKRWGFVLIVLAIMLSPLSVTERVSASTPAIGIENVVDSSNDANTNSFVITSPQGIKVFLDATKIPQGMEADMANSNNLALVTHKHADHYSSNVINGFKGQKLIGVKGTLVSGDVKIEGIESSHSFNGADGTNIIFIIDVAGVRMAAFGDCGQSALKPAQMEKLGRIDLAFCQFENMYSQADTANKKLYKLMTQVNPTVIVPTHIFSDKAIKLLNESWPAEAAAKTQIVLSDSLFAKGKRSIFLGKNASLALKAGVKASTEF